jgi:hypothetical protein
MADFWSTNSQKFKLTDDIDLNTLFELRMHDDTPDVFIQYVGLTRQLGRRWSAGAWYKYVEKEDIESHRALIDATYKDGALSNRFRLEYNVTGDSLLYRNKAALTAPVKLLNITLHPFVADEFFVNIDPVQNSRENRLWVGIGLKGESAGLKVSYLWRDTKHYNTEAICISTTIRF